MSGCATLKIRLAFDDDALLGADVTDVARDIVDAFNREARWGPTRARVIDAKWATPEDEWEARGGGWT